MTADQRFGIIITLLSVLSTASLAVIGVAIRDHFKLIELVDSVEELVKRKDSDHSEIKQRLTKVEESQLDFYRQRWRK